MKAGFLAFILAALPLPGLAQVNSQVSVSPGATVTTTTVETPAEAVTTKLKDGTPIELDSDNSVYRVYSDGARVAAPDGVHQLVDGTTITVKDGKRIP